MVKFKCHFSWHAYYLVMFKCDFSWQVHYSEKFNCHDSWQAPYLVKFGMIAGAQKCCSFLYKMLVPSAKGNLGCVVGC